MGLESSHQSGEEAPHAHSKQAVERGIDTDGGGHILALRQSPQSSADTGVLKPIHNQQANQCHNEDQIEYQLIALDLTAQGIRQTAQGTTQRRNSPQRHCAAGQIPRGNQQHNSLPHKHGAHAEIDRLEPGKRPASNDSRNGGQDGSQGDGQPDGPVEVNTQHPRRVGAYTHKCAMCKRNVTG